MPKLTQVINGEYIGGDKYVINQVGNGKSTVIFSPDQTIKAGTPVGAEIINEIQKNSLYTLKGTRGIVGSEEQYSINFEGFNDFECEELNCLFIPDVNNTSDKVSLLINQVKYTFNQVPNFISNEIYEIILNKSNKTVNFRKNQSRISTSNTIAELQSRKNLKVGDIVEVLGYYSAGDGAGHKRIIKAEDDGSGVQLRSGKWANIVHNGEVNVSWFGAKGDGITDDTDVIQKAINYNQRTLYIHFDKGKHYKITKTIILKIGVNLIGADINLPYHLAKNPTRFDIYVGKGTEDVSAFKMKQNTSIVGFTFFYPEQLTSEDTNVTPIKYGWSIDCKKDSPTSHNTDNVLIENVTLLNSYQGINLEDAGRFYLNNVYGQPIKTGIRIKNVFDMARATNVHLWTFSYHVKCDMYKWIYNNGTAFELDRADGVTMLSCFAFGYNIAFNFTDGFWGDLVSCSADVCRNPIFINNLNQVNITNGSYVTTSIINSPIFISNNMTGLLDISNVTLDGLYNIAIHSKADKGIIKINSVNSVKRMSENTEGYTFLLALIDGNAETYLNNMTSQYNDMSDQIYSLGNNTYLDGVKFFSKTTNLNLDNIDMKIWENGIPKNWSCDKNFVEQISNGIKLKVNPNKVSELIVKTLDYHMPQEIKFSQDVFMLKLKINSKISNTSGRFSIQFCRDDGLRRVQKVISSYFTGLVNDKELVLNIPFFFGYFIDSPILRFEWHSYDKNCYGEINIENMSISRINREDLDNIKLEKFIKPLYLDPYELNSFIDITDGIKTVYSTRVDTTSEWKNQDKILLKNPTSNLGWVYANGKWNEFGKIDAISQLNTPYMATKMQQDGVYGDYISYMDEKTLYDKQQRKLEEQKQLAYEEALKENPELTYEEFMSVQPMLLNIVEEPQPSQALKKFMEKYL